MFVVAVVFLRLPTVVRDLFLFFGEGQTKNALFKTTKQTLEFFQRQDRLAKTIFSSTHEESIYRVRKISYLCLRQNFRQFYSPT